MWECGKSEARTRERVPSQPTSNVPVYVAVAESGVENVAVTSPDEDVVNEEKV